MIRSKLLAKEYNYLAPDGSEIRLLTEIQGGGLAHCTLPADRVSSPVKHQTVEEIWYVLSGKGQLWQSGDAGECTTELSAGLSVSILVGNSFQFRNTGAEPLCILLVTIPPWPGEKEAIAVRGKWS